MKTSKRLAVLAILCLVIVMAMPAPVSAAEMWRSQTSAMPTYGHGDITFSDDHTGWIVGNAGCLLTTTNGGDTWSVVPSGTIQHLTAIKFVGTTTGWAAGYSGTVLKTNNSGASWNPLSTGTTVPLQDIAFCPDGTTGWAIGDTGTIIKTVDGGSNWTTQISGVTQDLRAISVLSDGNTAWVAGLGGVILHTTDGGATWTQQTSGTIYFLQDIDFVDANTGWATGTGSMVLHTTDGGATWTQQTCAGSSLIGVDFVDPNTGWVVGTNGCIAKTTDGGVTWTTQVTGTTAQLNRVHFINAGRGYAVGSSGTILRYDAGGTVTVTATAPTLTQTLTFSITAGTAPAGGSITDIALNFGTMASGTPKTATQHFMVTTNAANGYSVTAEEDHPLKLGATTIADVTGDTPGSITETTAAAWANNTTYGFGYSLANVTGTDAAFTTGFKQFANKAGSETAQVIMSNAGAVSSNQVDITYKLNLDPTQPGGAYSNTLTYICTGNF